MLVKLVQLWIADSPIEVTPSGIIIFPLKPVKTPFSSIREIPSKTPEVELSSLAVATKSKFETVVNLPFTLIKEKSEQSSSVKEMPFSLAELTGKEFQVFPPSHYTCIVSFVVSNLLNCNFIQEYPLYLFN